VSSFLLAVALVFIIEGALPFAAPALSKETWRRLVGMTDGQLRFVGLVLMLVGLGLLLFFW
jgi:uncharacterized protein